uniref:Collagen, type XIV, alpha 1a n=1 Tax=Oryzias melastigma TaxID=30732 RepID=A0A3B3CAB0_ORYME
NTVEMSWQKPSSRIEGFRIQVVSDAGQDFNLNAYATSTSITNLTPDVDYSVSISSYYDSEESLPIFGQLTSKYKMVMWKKCSVSAIADLVFLVDGSWSVGRENFKHIRSFIGSLAGAFDIGEDKTRVAVVQYSTDTRTEFPLTRYTRRGDLLQAINSLPYKGGNTMTGDALDYLIKNIFTEAAGSRKGFPKVAMIITDGKSQDPVEEYARRLRNIGVEIFVLGIKGADEDELREIASTPHAKHVYNVPNFDLIQEVQKSIITEVCSGVDDQLSSLVSGEEITEIASKSMRVTWDASLGEVTGYKLTLIPMVPGMKRQELYMGATQTSINVRDLSPETEYEISLFALKGLTPSEPLTDLAKTQPVKVLTDLLPPSNLQFSEITSRSFRATWAAPAASVLSYLVRYREAEDVTGDYISQAVPGHTTTTVLFYLTPVTTYEVNVYAEYEKGDSFALTGRPRFSPPVSVVLCSTQWCGRNTGSSNTGAGNNHSSPRAIPHHHLQGVCLS